MGWWPGLQWRQSGSSAAAVCALPSGIHYWVASPACWQVLFRTAVFLCTPLVWAFALPQVCAGGHGTFIQAPVLLSS